MVAARTGADVGRALAVLAQASRELGSSAQLDPVLVQLTEAAALGADAEVAVAWMPQHDGRRELLAARAVWASSSSLAAELEGRTAESEEAVAERVRSCLDDSAQSLVIPFRSAGGQGLLALARRDRPFES